MVVDADGCTLWEFQPLRLSYHSTRRRKFGQGGYKTSGGLHGGSTVNALSSWLGSWNHPWWCSLPRTFWKCSGKLSRLEEIGTAPKSKNRYRWATFMPDDHLSTIDFKYTPFQSSQWISFSLLKKWWPLSLTDKREAIDSTMRMGYKTCFLFNEDKENLWRQSFTLAGKTMVSAEVALQYNLRFF